MSPNSLKASGPDEILAQILRGTPHSIAPSITKMFNTSIRQDISLIAGKYPQLFQYQNLACKLLVYFSSFSGKKNAIMTLYFVLSAGIIATYE